MSGTRAFPPFKPDTLVDVLRWRAAHQGDAPAFSFLVEGGPQLQRLTWAELDARARSVGALLQLLGLRGERLLLFYPPGLTYIVALVGCFYAGVVPVPVTPPRNRQHLPRLREIALDIDPAGILLESAHSSPLRALLKEEDSLARRAMIPTDEASPEAAALWKPSPVSGGELAYIQYSSGTTGAPKGIMVPWNALLFTLAALNVGFEAVGDGPGLTWLPPYHDAGLVGGILQPIYLGTHSLLMSPMAMYVQPRRWLQAISDHRVVVSGGPDFAFQHCVEQLSPEQRVGLDLSSWRVAPTGAEVVRLETLERFAEAFGPVGFRKEAFCPCYGMAEAMITTHAEGRFPRAIHLDRKALDAGRVVLSERPSTTTRTLVSNGDPMRADVVVRIVDPQTGEPTPGDRVGEVWVAGPGVTAGYWNRPELTRESFQASIPSTGEGPFLRTGDLGFFHQGEVYLTGRIKDMIVTRSRSWYPEGFETLAGRSHPALRVEGSAAFFVDLEGGERYGLVIVQELDTRAEVDPNEVISHIREHIELSTQIKVHSVYLIRPGSIPRTTSGKIMRYACRQAWEEGTLKVITSWRGLAPSVEA